MCGICGVLVVGNSPPVDEEVVRQMAGRMSHRGPDDSGFHFAGDIGLGFRRLSIIDVAGGHQPLHNEERSVWVTFNGEIYNFQALRGELEGRGHLFSTRSDTEVIVHAYEEWGDNCVCHFNGIFGLAVWDARQNHLLLARDHFGVKPLYFYQDAQHLAWASELKALLADPSIRPEVDRDGLELFLSLRFVPSPSTMLKGVRKLRPGHRLIAERDGLRIERYWHPRIEINHTLSEADYVTLLQRELETAVRRQMMSDVPIGALLSGGADSAAVVAIMAQCTAVPVRTFTVGFPDGGELNELDDARRTAALLGTEHHALELMPTDFLDGLGHALWHLEEPISSASSLLMHLVCRLAGQYVKVVLTGQGADEPFCGYHRYLGERYGAAYRHIPKAVRALLQRSVGALTRSERLNRAVTCLDSPNVVERFADVYAVFPRDLRSRLWRASQRPTDADGLLPAAIEYWRDGVEQLDPLVQMSFVDARLSLSDDFLLYGDKMAMAASIEARVPFLDLELMRAAEALPSRYRIRRWQRKSIYRKVVAKWLPKEILNRPKRGFDLPIDRWFRSDLRDQLSSILLASDGACMEYFNPGPVHELLDDHASGRRQCDRQLYNLLVFEMWHRQFIRGGTRPRWGGAPLPHAELR